MGYKALVGLDENGKLHGIVWFSAGTRPDVNAAAGEGEAVDRFFLEDPKGRELERVSDNVLKDPSTGLTYTIGSW
jgi:hypothetical protein